MPSDLDALAREHLGNSSMQLAVAAAVAGVLFGGGLLVRRVVRKRHAAYAATPERELLELPLRVLSGTTSLFLVVLAVFGGVSALQLPPAVRTGLNTTLLIVVVLQSGLWATTLLVAWIESKRSEGQDSAAVSSLGILGFIGRLLIWTLVTAFALDNLGINVTGLVAGLGIGGVAVALAVQNVLGDLFASLSIALDKPFAVGDFLVAGEFMGKVERIGIKSVRLRSLSGEQIVMSNADLLGSRLRNYGDMFERRVVLGFGVTYQTPRAKLEAVPGMLRAIVDAEPDARFDRAHFFRFGASSLDFEAVYYVLSPDYNRYMDVQQAIDFALHAALEREGIAFAYPTQTLWLHAPRPVPG